VAEQTEEHGSQWATICSIAAKIRCIPETLRRWVKQAERKAGITDGVAMSGIINTSLFSYS
jgi:transposase